MALNDNRTTRPGNAGGAPSGSPAQRPAAPTPSAPDSGQRPAAPTPSAPDPGQRRSVPQGGSGSAFAPRSESPHYISARSSVARQQRGKKNARRRPSPLARLVNAWWNRLISSVYEGSLSEQEAEYESGSTSRDYLWNTVGTSVWGMVFPLLTIVCTQLVGAEQAGMFSMAFVAGTLLMILSNFGVRTFQVSDIDEAVSFSSYQLNRWITSALALGVGILYCMLRGYSAGMFTLSVGIYVYKVVDGMADVYEGRLQQADKLYLAGMSQALRSLVVVAAFSLLLFITRNLPVACVAAGIAAVASLVLVTFPLALLETEKSGPWRGSEVGGILKQCFPLFSALFLFNVIESCPKFAMESMVDYENQLYFSALYFPAQAILLAVGFVYKPQLLRLANIWSNPRRRRRFDLIMLAVMAVVVVITLAVMVFMGWIGLDIMGFMYGLDFEPYRVLALLMVAAGGVTAAIDFLYQIITVLRHQELATKPYLVSFAAAAVLSVVLVYFFGLTGAVVSYLAVMVLLLILLAMQYVRIRGIISRTTGDPFARRPHARR